MSLENNGAGSNGADGCAVELKMAAVSSMSETSAVVTLPDVLQPVQAAGVARLVEVMYAS